jgi:hypothetical protein
MGCGEAMLSAAGACDCDDDGAAEGSFGVVPVRPSKLLNPAKPDANDF